MSTEQVQYELSLRDLLTSKLREADGAAKTLETTISGVGKMIAVSLSAAAIVNFGRKMIEAGTTVENARTGLTTLLKDSNEAGMVIKNTMQDATTTPFAFEGLLAANKALISAGVDSRSARQDVLNLANAIAATGGGDDELQRMVINLQQIKNTGKATALDIKQFAYAGVNVYKLLADATGKPIEKVKDMEVSYEMLTMALKKAHDQGGVYANGLENMAKNTSVKLSNVGDAMFQFLVKIFDALKPIIDPILDGLNNAVGWVSEKFSQVSGTITAMAQNVMDVFSSIVNFLRPLFEPIGNYLQTVWNGVKRIWAALMELKPVFGIILTAAREALGWIFNALAWVSDKVSRVIAIIIEFAAILYRILEKLGIIYVVQKICEAAWFVIKKIGEGLAWIYDHTIKPIVDGISWAYNKIKGLLGMGTPSDVAVTVTKKTETMNSPETIAPGAGKPKAPTMDSPAKTQTKGAQGTKAITVTIHINSLIKDFKISTTNLHESANAIREKVTEALLSATNDSQRIVGPA